MTPKQLTVDDVRHHAEEVRDLAVAEVNKVADQATKAVIVGAVALIAVVSIAYYLGQRSIGSDF